MTASLRKCAVGGTLVVVIFAGAVLNSSSSAAPPAPKTNADSDGDGMPDAFEGCFSLNAFSASDASEDRDGDGVSNLDEYRRGTHPSQVASLTRYLAEGATGAFFKTELAVLNPSETLTAHVVLRFQLPDGSERPTLIEVPPHTRRTVDVGALAGMGDKEFSTVVETDALVVVDRTMSWAGSGYGGHLESAMAFASDTWYLAEGATHSNFALFYLLQNPNASEVTATVRYLRPAPAAVLEKHYSLPPHSRTNIWVNHADPALVATDVSAKITATLPIIVERAMYQTNPGRPLFNAGHESAGVTATATVWFLAEGATGPYFDLFILIANPNSEAASIEANFLRPDGMVVTRTYTVAPNSRFNIWVDQEGALLADTAVSTTIVSTNSVGVIVERAMWWAGSGDTWFEAHNSPGTTTLDTRWALAAGEAGGPRNVETYILLANPKLTPIQASVKLVFEDGTTADRAYTLSPQTRTNVPVGIDFPQALGKRFGAIVIGDDEFAVERAMYWDANGVQWAAGTNALASRLPDAVTGLNRDPVASADSVTTTVNSAITIDVLANDTDPDGDALAIASVTQPASGAAVIQGPWVSFTPAPGFAGATSFSYTISDGNGGTGTAVVSVDITTSALPELRVDDVSLTEDDAGSASLVFTIALSAASALTTTVHFATADGSASSADDYAAVTGTVEIPPGRTTTEISVPIHGDTRPEADETLLLNLSNAANARIGGGPAVGTILDDDASGPTTFELIGQALNAGLIDEETALIYKMYDSYGDARLPQAYRGRDDRFIDNPVIDEVRKRFDSLSPPTQGLLAPFLIPADEPGSWMDQRPSAPAGADASPTAGARREVTTSAAGLASEAFWTRVDTTNGKASVWWRSDRPSDAARARAFAAELDRYLWAKLTLAFKAPLPDITALGPTGPIYHGGDPRLDILLTTADRAMTAVAADACDGSPRGTVIELTPLSGKDELAHELMHAITHAYPTLTCQGGQSEQRWMYEATGTWAQQFAYPLSNSEHGNRTHKGADDYLNAPGVPLNHQNDAHEYGAYLWFFHLAGQGNDPTVVKRTWEAAATRGSLDAVESTLQSLGFGGFDAQWPRFVANNWNRVAADNAPYRKYFAWDKLRWHASQEEIELSLPQGAGWGKESIPYVLPRLSAHYRHYDLTKDPKIRGLSFQNRPAGNTPTASIQAIIKIKGQPWRLAEDWSREKEKFFCRDKPEEDIEKIAIVIANRGFRPADPEIQGNDGFNLFYSALPCSDWTGSTTYRLEERFGGEEHIVTAEAGALRFHVDLADNRSFWRAIEGTVTVRASWTWPYADGTCTQTGTRSFDAKDDAFFTLLPAAGNTLEFTGRSLVVPPTPPTISTTVTCSISSGTFTYTLDVPAYGINWFNTGPNGWPVDPTAPITGTYLSGDERWTWTFTKVQ